MPKTVLPDHAIVLAFIRQGQGWSQADLARMAGTAPNVINDYERGRKPLTRPRLEQLLACMAVPADRIEATLSCLAGNRAASWVPSGPGELLAETRPEIDRLALRYGRLVEEFTRSTLHCLTLDGEALHGRQTAELLWRSLKPQTAAERRLLVEDVRKFRHWALVERLAAESIERAANHPREALELAELALAVAERVPGNVPWRSRLAGYAWVHLANGRRVCNELHAMESSLARALQLWEEGASGDPGLLNPAVVPWIEAACRRAQRRFKEALKRVDEALELDRGELRGKILLTKSGIFKALGDAEGSTSVLMEAAPLIDGKKEPRVALYLRLNLLSDLCRLGRAAEAEPKLEESRRLAAQMGQRIDLTRILWLGGLAAAGLGRGVEAEKAFRQARREFEAHQLAFDYALVSLDLSLLLLEQGRNGEVREVAEEMLGIFGVLKIGRDGMMALGLFCEAAKRDAATIELTQRVLRFLQRAQHDPELRFEETAGTEAE
jgi:transcriptional regulator with XRE-family HTH domain